MQEGPLDPTERGAADERQMTTVADSLSGAVLRAQTVTQLAWAIPSHTLTKLYLQLVLLTCSFSTRSSHLQHSYVCATRTIRLCTLFIGCKTHVAMITDLNYKLSNVKYVHFHHLPTYSVLPKKLENTSFSNRLIRSIRVSISLKKTICSQRNVANS